MKTSASTYKPLRVNAWGLALAIVSIAFFMSTAAAHAAISVSSSTPANGAVVKGNVSWTANASSPDGIKQVVFYVDGKWGWLEGLAPYVFNGDGKTWNTTTVSDGTHQLKLVATSKKGEVATQIISVTVRNTTSSPTPTPTAPTGPTAPTPTAPTGPTAPTPTAPTGPTAPTPTAPTGPTEPAPIPPTEPTPPAGSFAATALDHSRVKVSWPAASGAVKTQVLRDGLVVGTRATGVGYYTDAMLWYATGYSYTVKSYNSAGAQVASYGPATAVTKPLPSAGFPVSFGTTAIWGKPIAAGSPKHARNADFMAYLTSHAKNPNMAIRSYGIPVYQAEVNDATYGPFKCDYACDLNKAGKLPIPDGAKPDPGTDLHMSVISADGSMSWDYYKPGKDATTGLWNYARTGVYVPMTGNGVVSKSLAGANAANFSNIAGLIRPEELAQGRIDHALALGIPGIASGAPACPATHNVGVGGDANALPEGARLQLDPSLDLNSLGLPAWQKTVARALQVYGAYVRDNSGTLSIYGETSSPTLGGRGYDGWNKANVGLGTTGGSQSFSSAFPWSKLSVLDFKYGPDC